MTYLSPDPIASGRPYPITEVAHQTPSQLEDFVGDTVFTLTTTRGTQTVSGVGSSDGDVVRFHEKDAANSTKDVRVWRISRGAGDGFVAESTSAF